MSKNILLMTNRMELFASLNTIFNDHDFFVVSATNTDSAKASFKQKNIAAVLWDLDSTTWQDTVQAITNIRQEQLLPIIVLSNQTSSPKVNELFEMHLDDFLPGPIDEQQVLMITKQRIWTYERFLPSEDTTPVAPTSNPNSKANNVFKFEDLTINMDHYSVKRDDEDLGLTPKEFQLLEYLVSHANQVISRDQLLEGVWGYDIMGTSRMVDIHISHLRDKIEKDPKNPTLIKTVRGFGYIFSPK